MAVIFDLDQTLINSQLAEPLRKARNWSAVYPMIPQLRPYDGIPELLQFLHEQNIPVCIVTSSPESYCSRVIRHWGWTIVTPVCYHDTQFKKPHPEPILLGLQRLGVQPAAAVAVGDDPKDIQAAKAAGVFAIGVAWGCQSRVALQATRPDVLCDTVDELRRLLLKRFKR